MVIKLTNPDNINGILKYTLTNIDKNKYIECTISAMILVVFSLSWFLNLNT